MQEKKEEEKTNIADNLQLEVKYCWGGTRRRGEREELSVLKYFNLGPV